jgi:Tol biopolymer transport system component
LPPATATAAPPTAVPGGGGLVAFASNQDGDWDIYTIDTEQGSLQELTHNDSDDLSPSWSPDGAQIAFVSNRDGSDEIYIMSADGSDQRRLTETDASESFPAWSPDGTEISFDSDRDGNWEIYVMTSDGSNVRRLTNDPADDWISSWSPDGNRIVFESKRDGNYEIYVMDADGAEQGSDNQQRLTENRAHDGFPAWSPDGKQIAFMSRRDGNYEIYVMNADGTNQRRVTYNRAEDSDPAWSPDGEWLTFVSQRDGNDEIYVVSIDGTLDRRLTTNSSLDWGPAWQPYSTTSGRASTWIRTFEGPDYGAFFDIVLAENGNALAVGATNHVHMPPYSGDALLMKLTLEGDVLWERTWGGDGYEQAISIAFAGDGGAYVFGETDSYGSGNRDFFLLKTTEDGSEDWFKTYGGSGREWPFGMLRLSNEDLLVYGLTEPGTGGDRDQYALRVGPDGEVIWEYTVAGPGEELVIDALETAEGDLILAVVVEEDGQLVKLDADGNTLWTKLYELSGWQYASQIAETDEGGFLLAGFSMSSSPRRQVDTWLARCTAAGDLQWEKSFGDATHDDYGTSLIRLEDGTYLIGGIGNGILLSRVDQDGDLLWRRSLVGENVYGSDGLIELEDGGHLVAGFIQITNGRSYDAILLRTDSEGQIGE